MNQCQEWMKDPTAKCLYWGLILVVLLLVVYHLRNPENFQVGILESCAHGQCKDLEKVNTLTADAHLGHASVVREDPTGNEEPFADSYRKEYFQSGILEGCAHGQCPDLTGVNTLFRTTGLGHGTVVSLDTREEPFKLPPGSEYFANKRRKKQKHRGIPGPSRECLLDVEDFAKAGTGPESSALLAALGGGVAGNVRYL